MKNSLRVTRAVVEMARKEFTVEPSRKILYLVEERNVADGDAGAGYRHEAHESPIADETSDEGEHLGAPSSPQFQHQCKEVANCDPLGDTLESPCTQIEPVER